MEDKKLTWKHYLLIAVIAVLAIYFVIGFYFSKKFFWGTKINGINVAGKSTEEVVEIFNKNAKDFSLKLKERKNQTEILTSDQIKAKFEGTDEIRQIKKTQGSFGWIKGLLGMEHYDGVTMYSYDKTSVKKACKKLDVFNSKKMIKIEDAKPVYKEGKFVIQKEEEGTELKKAQARKQIDQYIKDGVDTLSFEKENCYNNPKYTSKSDELVKLIGEMNKNLKGSITYKFGKQEVVLDKDTYNKWLKPKKDYSGYKVDKDSMENWVLKFMYKYNTQYGWHTFKTHDGRTKKIYGGPYGWRISKDKEMASVKKMLKEGTTETRQPYWREKGKVYDGVNGDIGDTYVEVDMGAQTVYYYKKGKLKFTTSCVTGKMTADRKTPECVAYILYKQPTATLNGQGYSSPVKYWMPFVGNVGFHSASWRSSFGGSEYISDGSHGCVNLPTSSAAVLYKLVSKGDPVVTYY